MKDNILLFSIILILSGCNTKTTLDPRRAMINKFISGIEKQDTIQLYSLLDTSINFRAHTRQTFLDQISYIKSRLKLCGDLILDSAIKINDIPPYSQEYIIPFCRGRSGEAEPVDFELHFIFANYDSEVLIHYFDLVRQRGKITPTIALPIPN